MNQSSETLIEARDLKLCYHSNCVVSGLSFQVLKGTLTAVTGPNGSGKSTLMKTLAGLHPYRGYLQISPDVSLGYLPQVSPQDFQFPLTVADFVEMGLWKKKTTSRIQCVHKALKAMKAEELIHKSITQLSRGQFQRVAMARTIVHEPQLIFLDEPLTGLDEKTIELIFESVVQFTQQGGTALMVLHDEERRNRFQMGKIQLHSHSPPEASL